MLLGQQESQRLEDGGVVALARGAVALGGQEGSARLEGRVIGDGEAPIFGEIWDTSVGQVALDHFEKRVGLLGRRLVALKPA